MVDRNAREVGGLTLPEINHLGVVVRNRDAAIRRYTEALGIGPFHTYDRHFPNAQVRGEPLPCSLRIGFGNLGTVLFEVIEPLEGPSIHQEFLDQHGEGIHHLAFVIPDLAGDLTKLEAHGLRVLMRVDLPERQSGLAYIEGEATGGALLELIQDSPGTQEFFNRLWEATRG